MKTSRLRHRGTRRAATRLIGRSNQEPLTAPWPGMSLWGARRTTAWGGSGSHYSALAGACCHE
jgi:hypothetical protein